ncbi:MAG: ExbD/TolR family protein [Pseudomonadota bacterium]|nr:ExbD/TolR family protein [Pseudomonadota bacterium]
MSEINVTPFVDVMLVLLIIFMISAPLLTVGVPVDLPKANAASISENVEPLVVSITVDKQIWLGETPVEFAGLVPMLMAISNANPDARIYVKADRLLDYGTVMETMGAISVAGFRKVALVAEPPVESDLR